MRAHGNMFTRLLKWLTTPTAVPPQAADLRRSRLLLSMLVGSLLISALSILLIPLQFELTRDPAARLFIIRVDLPLYLAIAVALLVAYFRARAGAQRLPAWMFTGVAFGAVFALVYVFGRTELIIGMGLSTVLAGLLLSWRATLAVCVAVLVATFALLVPKVGFYDLINIMLFIFAFGIFGLIYILVRDQDLRQMEHQAQEILDNNEKLLGARKMEAIARLSAGIAHEFNNVNMSIMGYSEIIAAKSTKTAAQYAERIKDACLRAHKLTDNLLSFSNQQLMHRTGTNINQLISIRGEILRKSRGGFSTLNLDLDPEIGNAYVDPELTDRALDILIARAVENAGAGGAVTIRTSTLSVMEARYDVSLQPGSYLIVTVIDNGPPTNKEILDRIFEPFFTTGEFGTGDLDLAAAYGIINQSGGCLYARSGPETGNFFVVFLPQEAD